MADASSNKRIAKNTLLLYARMVALMAISLYTSRVVLEALGVADFGLYNVIGGFVAMFAIISGSISASISRFLTYELGRGDQERLKNIFSTSTNILLIISAIILIVAETLGLWFLNYKMEIPDGRVQAANWVFQLSLVTFIINLLAIPYNAAIISHEKMSAFAYISIIEGVGKLAIAYMVMLDKGDRLIIYAIAMSVLACFIRFLYTVYCKRHFEECTYQLKWDRALTKDMFGFAGWNFIGASSAILRNQGGNVVINLFFGTVVNAACGIANQVNHAVTGFVTNFMTALNPQITKSYASGDHAYMMTLVFQGSRLSFYMLLLLSLPIIICSDYILSIWLTTVPEYAPLFVQLTLVLAMSESISNPLVTAMLATGNIRNYQIIVGGLQMLNLPVFYILLKIGFPPQWVYITMIVISQLCLFARLWMLRGMIGLDAAGFLKKVYFNTILVSLVSLAAPLFLKRFIQLDFMTFILLCVFTVVWTSGVIYIIGLNRADRKFVKEKIRMAIHKISKRHK